jgi:hypothetical protein
MNYLLLATAFSLSAVAAFYSIAGLMAIFAGATTAIAVMGGILEVAKLVVTSWLYRNWSETPRVMKAYFCMAIAILMLLTSMGIFGFLSKAHVDQNLVSGDIVAQLSLIDEQIKIEKETIDAARKTLSQLDNQVDQTLIRSTTEVGASNSASLRARQAKERQATQKEILSAQAKINKLNTDKAPIAAQVRQVEAEVGPVKYIAALIYGDNPEANVLEKAVRWVILLIVFVFDPLAVLMFVAYNQTTMKRKEPLTIIDRIVEPVVNIDPQPVTEVTIEDLVPEIEGADYNIQVSETVTIRDRSNGVHHDGVTGIGNIKF